MDSVGRLAFGVWVGLILSAEGLNRRREQKAEERGIHPLAASLPELRHPISSSADLRLGFTALAP